MANIKHLLPQVPQYFKTNLHTHTTISDGKLTPAEAKEAYKAAGYRVLCLTDHNVIVNHSDMNDPDFLFLTGTEINIDEENSNSYTKKTYHLNLISKRPDNLWSPGKPQHVKHPGAQQYVETMHFEGMEYSYTPDGVNAVIAAANEHDYFVMYNHPTWSCQSYPDYAPIKGLWGMEVRNSECNELGNNENNFRVYKDLLNVGNRLYPTGTDDLHSPRALGKSWIMVGAPELSYESVIGALEKGDFYMSCGPQIDTLAVEGSTLKLTCSGAQKVALETYGRFARCVFAGKDALLESAEFDLTPFLEKCAGDPAAYVYLTVTAPDGSYAVTRAYSLSELA